MTIELESAQSMVIGRREFVAGCAILTANWAARSNAAEALIGTTKEIRGEVHRKRGNERQRLLVGGDIMNQDIIMTGANGYADIELEGNTRLRLGRQTECIIDNFLASAGGTIELGMGQIIFDRPKGMPKTDTRLRTAFGMIGVRGTRFFCEVDRGAFAVFVDHGEVCVEAGGSRQSLRQGEGVEISRPGDPPSELTVWSEARITEAYASLGLTRRLTAPV